MGKMGSDIMTLDTYQTCTNTTFFGGKIGDKYIFVNLSKVIAKPNCKVDSALANAPSTICAGSGDLVKSSCTVSIV